MCRACAEIVSVWFVMSVLIDSTSRCTASATTTALLETADSTLRGGVEVAVVVVVGVVEVADADVGAGAGVVVGFSDVCSF